MYHLVQLNKTFKMRCHSIGVAITKTKHPSAPRTLPPLGVLWRKTSFSSPQLLLQTVFPDLLRLRRSKFLYSTLNLHHVPVQVSYFGNADLLICVKPPVLPPNCWSQYCASVEPLTFVHVRLMSYT